MAALNALFAQFTGAGPAPPSPLSERERRVNGGGTSSVPVGSDGGSAARHGNGNGGLGGSSRDRAGGSSSTSDSFGVALTGSVIVFDPKKSEGDFETPQCETLSTLPEPCDRRTMGGQGALVVASAEFACYRYKGSIRIIHRSTGANAIIKMSNMSSGGTPQDMSIMSTFEYSRDVSGLLACSTAEGDVLIWELQVRSPGTSPSTSSGGAATVVGSGSKAVEVSVGGFLSITGGGAQSVAWQPRPGYRYLAIACGTAVVITDVTSLNATSAARVVGGYPSVTVSGQVPGSVCLGHTKQVTALSFSTKGNVLATAGKDGLVMLWDTRHNLLHSKPMPRYVSCLSAFRIAPEGPMLQRVLVMNAVADTGGTLLGNSRLTVITGGGEHRVLKVWVARTRYGSSALSSRQTPTAGGGMGRIEDIRPRQEVSIRGKGPLTLDADPGGEFLFAAESGEGLLYALHLTKGSDGPRLDYLRLYGLVQPVQGVAALEQAAEPEFGYEDDNLPSNQARSLQVVCVQTKCVQVYRIMARDALPPRHILKKDEDGGGDASGLEPTAPRVTGSTQVEDIGVGSDSSAVSKEGGGRGSSAVGRSMDGLRRDSATFTVGGVKFEKKLDVTDEPLGPTTKTPATITPPILSRQRLPDVPQSRVASTSKTPAGDFPATGARVGVMLGDGAGGGGFGLRSEGETRREDSASVSTAAVGSSPHQSTTDSWEGAAEHDWDQDGGDHHAGVVVAGAATVPTTAGGDSVSETSSVGHRDATPPPVLRPAVVAVSGAGTTVTGAPSTATGVTSRGPASSAGAGNGSSSSTPSGLLPQGGSTASRGLATKDTTSRYSSRQSGGATTMVSSGHPPPPPQVGVSDTPEASDTPSAMPSAAPRERPASPEFRRFLTPHELESFGAPSSAGSGTTSSVSSAAVAAAAAAGRTAFGTHDPPDAAVGEEEGGGESSTARGDGGAEEQSVSVSVSEERQEVGATTTEDTPASVAASLAPTDGSGGAGVGQSTTSAIFSGGESTDASYQGGRESMNGGNGGGGGAGAGEPSASGGPTSSAHGDASGGSSSSMVQQLGREADNSAGGAPLSARPPHAMTSPSSSSAQRTSGAVTSSVPDATGGTARSSPTGSEVGGISRQPPPPPTSTSSTMPGASQVVSTAVGEASRDPGAMSGGRSIPGVNVDKSATLALRSLLLGAGGGTTINAGASTSNSYWPASEVPTAPGNVPPPRADAEGAGAGIARPPPTTGSSPSLRKPKQTPGSTQVPFGQVKASSGKSTGASASGTSMTGASSNSSASTTSPAVVTNVPLPRSMPDNPTSATTNNSGSMQPMRSVPAPTSGTSVATVSASIKGSRSGGMVGSKAIVGLRPPPASPGMDDMEAGARAEERPTLPALGGRVSNVANARDASADSARTEQVSSSVSVAAHASVALGGGAFGSTPASRAGVRPGGDDRRDHGLVASGVGTTELTNMIKATIAAELGGSTSQVKEHVSQVVTARCREVTTKTLSATKETRNSDHAALLEEISTVVDRNLRRSLTDLLMNSLANVVVNSVRQAADPLTASVANLHAREQRIAMAAHSGAQAGVQASAPSQVPAFVTAATRAQAGTVRREVLDCSEELGRAVAASSQDPIREAFRECFEGQLIPRIQAAVQRMFEQINDTLTRGLQASPLVNSRAGALTEDVANIRNRVEGLETGLREVISAMSRMSEQMERLAELTIAVQRTTSSTASVVEKAHSEAQARASRASSRTPGSQQGGRPWPQATPPLEPAAPTPPPVTVDPREELSQLLAAGRLEEAMDRALSASDVPLVMWLCGRLHPSNTPPTLPQHILLCLLQQLGASDLLEDTSVKLQWLQNCALAVDTTEPRIITHLPLVLTQLRSALATAGPTIADRGGADVSVLRMTAHVVNSLALTAGSSGVGVN